MIGCHQWGERQICIPIEKFVCYVKDFFIVSFILNKLSHDEGFVCLFYKVGHISSLLVKSN